MTRATCKTEAQRVRALAAIQNSELPLDIRWKPWKEDRSLQQNALSHAWYKAISDQRGDMTPEQARRFCKLHYGVPILRGDDADYCAAYDAAIKPLDYETKMGAMRYWPVTRLMNVDQMQQYLDAVQAGWSEQGVWLQ